jgi:hypothetical protein
LRATIDGYQLIPVFNYLEEENNNLDFNVCPYVDAIYNYNYGENDQETFGDVASFILPIVSEPMAKAYNLTDASNVTFKVAYRIADHLKAYDFEGVGWHYYFTPEQWYYSRIV